MVENMKTAYFQMTCGASGDMILSSLLNAGVPVSHLSEQLGKTGIEGLEISVEKVLRNGILCSHLIISCPVQKQFRHSSVIKEIVTNGRYADRVAANAFRIIDKLAQAEALVHGIPVEKVHFHEIGAVDTIVDILGTCICLEYLKIDKVYFSAFNTGKGEIRAVHGVMPNPAPATTELIRGFTVVPLDIEAEILTPTGAAVLTAIGQQCAEVSAGKLLSAGYGCGDRIFEGRSNLLRVLIIENDSAPEAGVNSDTVCVLESDMDHVSGEVLGFASEEILAAGALDVTYAPVFMKKNRPGYRITVICRPEDLNRMAYLIIANTRTLGVRYRYTGRFVAKRESIESAGKDVLLKKCSYGSVSFTKAEYESLARIAREKNIPFPDVAEHYQSQREFP
jgi:uncharacterized protein (TIGR00299 family) protein